ncbi:hypothetical protein QBC42DRAFT_249017 [Cladorrhinum samala]|uniref:Uncharacterized protein n=1 Tax=Cladorrhinum samala TaxID=585594 RepID=A0AAV9HZK4_9PEZI|nr:hypothetical protein QBC42DRAFT_249017 [Cladorrhinum samala]
MEGNDFSSPFMPNSMLPPPANNHPTPAFSPTPSPDMMCLTASAGPNSFPNSMSASDGNSYDGYSFSHNIFEPNFGNPHFNPGLELDHGPVAIQPHRESQIHRPPVVVTANPDHGKISQHQVPQVAADNADQSLQYYHSAVNAATHTAPNHHRQELNGGGVAKNHTSNGHYPAVDMIVPADLAQLPQHQQIPQIPLPRGSYYHQTDFFLSHPCFQHRAATAKPIDPFSASSKHDNKIPYIPTALQTASRNRFSPFCAELLPPFAQEKINRVVTLPARFVGPVGLLYSDATFVVSRYPATSPSHLSTRWSGKGLANMMAAIGAGAGAGAGAQGRRRGAGVSDEWVLCLRIRDWPRGQVARFPWGSETDSVIELVKGTFDLLPDGKEEWYVVRGVEPATGERWIKVVRGWVAKQDNGEEEGDEKKDDEEMNVYNVYRGGDYDNAEGEDDEDEEEEDEVVVVADDDEDDDDDDDDKEEEKKKVVEGLEDWVKKHKGVVEGDKYGQQVLSFMSEPSYEKRGWGHGRDAANKVPRTSRRRLQQVHQEDE